VKNKNPGCFVGMQSYIFLCINQPGFLKRVWHQFGLAVLKSGQSPHHKNLVFITGLERLLYRHSELNIKENEKINFCNYCSW
jgi:hypothetical protein